MRTNFSPYRSAIPVAFPVAFVLFFFSFCNLKCNGTKVASLKGINLVTGTHLKTQAGSLLDRNSLNNDETLVSSQKVPANFWAILAFLSAIAGVIIFYRKPKTESLIGTILGAVGFISLIMMQYVIREKVDQKTGIINIEVGFTLAYWIDVLSFLTAAVFSFLSLKNENKADGNKYGNFSPPEKPMTVEVKIITKNED